MKNATIDFPDSIRSLSNATASVLALFTLLVAVSTLAAAQVTVFVSGKASGDFGNPVATLVPFVPALTVTGPGTIQRPICVRLYSERRGCGGNRQRPD